MIFLFSPAKNCIYLSCKTNRVLHLLLCYPHLCDRIISRANSNKSTYQIVYYKKIRDKTDYNQNGHIRMIISGQTLVGINDIETTDSSIYPNPCSNHFSIKANSGVIIKHIEFLTIDGRTVWQKDLNDNETEIPLINIKNGLHVIRLITDTGVIITKKIIQE
ncbi:T9SS C-terminal target domain-containing protein [Marinilabiliaceae bacterium JC017]|nr:T9SS C-terminal target domain-containing protein [Marinilabiliaceae bacterium JC017]